MSSKPKDSHRVRPTKAHMMFLVAFMERNPIFAREQLEDEELVEQQWESLALGLNSLNDESRPTLAWRRTWQDKKRAIQDKLNSGSTMFDSVEKRIIAVLRLEKQLTGSGNQAVGGHQASRGYQAAAGRNNSAIPGPSGLRRPSQDTSNQTSSKRLKLEDTCTVSAMQQHNSALAGISANLSLMVKNQNDLNRVVEQTLRKLISSLNEVLDIISTHFGQCLENNREQEAILENSQDVPYQESPDIFDENYYNGVEAAGNDDLNDPPVEEEAIEILEDDTDYQDVLNYLNKNKKKH